MGRFGLLWFILDQFVSHFGSFLVVLDCFSLGWVSLWAVSARVGSFRSHFGSFWLLLVSFGLFWVYLDLSLSSFGSFWIGLDLILARFGSF